MTELGYHPGPTLDGHLYRHSFGHSMKIVKEYRERAAHADDLAKTVSSDEQRRLIHEVARAWRTLAAQRVRQLNGPESTFVKEFGPL